MVIDKIKEVVDGTKSDDEKPVEQDPEQSKLDRLTYELSETNKVLRATFSWRATIIRGLLLGLATVIGATIIAGGFFSALRGIWGDSEILHRPDLIPFSEQQYNE